MIAKSIGAVAAGIGANLLAIPLDGALAAAGVFPSESEGPYALALAYRAALAVLGGYTTARLAPSSPQRHALVLGAIGVALSALGAVAQWPLGHHWYPLSLVLVSLPASWAGARLHPAPTLVGASS